MPRRGLQSNIPLIALVGLLGWFIPGAGHWLLQERIRAVIIFVTITGLFGLGLYVGSVAAVDSVNEDLWYAAQMLTSPLVAALGHLTATRGYQSFGKPLEIGQIYTSIAGMLNLLCIINAIYLADCRGRAAKGC
jgi:hypothetical protein